MITKEVASFTDAWIETGTGWYDVCQSSSHLLQMRGLKLKKTITIHTRRSVASFTDAWIETTRMEYALTIDAVASFTDAWIETL